MKTYDAHETGIMKRLHGSELASFQRRAAAIAVDAAAASLLFVLVMIPAEPILIARGWIRDNRTIVFTFFGNWYSTAWLALYFSLSTYFGKGRTAGKRLMGIRTVSLVHDRVSLWQSIERSMGYGFSILELGFGFIQFFINPNRRTVHDRVAETLVIREHSKRRNQTDRKKPK
jgi:uncharacterized RDD family membrane protein YckC